MPAVGLGIENRSGVRGGEGLFVGMLHEALGGQLAGEDLLLLVGRLDPLLLVVS